MFSARRQCNVHNEPNNDAIISISFKLSTHNDIGYTEKMSTDQPARKGVLRRCRASEQMLHTATAANCAQLTVHQLLISCTSVIVPLADCASVVDQLYECHCSTS